MVVGDSQNPIAPHTIIRETCPDHSIVRSSDFWIISERFKDPLLNGRQEDEYVTTFGLNNPIF